MFGESLYKLYTTDNVVEELFLGNSSHLKHVIQWKHNRPPDMDRVKEIKQYIERTKRVDGIIYLAERWKPSKVSTHSMDSFEAERAGDHKVVPAITALPTASTFFWRKIPPCTHLQAQKIELGLHP